MEDDGLCREALSLVPGWVYNALFDTFARLEPATAVMLAQTILEAFDGDPR